MKLIGIRDGRTVTVARLFEDDTVAPVAEVVDFYADLDVSLAAAGALTRGSIARSAVVEVPAVPPAARVLCVGLNYRMHADEAGMKVPDHPAIFGRWTASLVASGVPAPVPAGEPGCSSGAAPVWLRPTRPPGRPAEPMRASRSFAPSRSSGHRR